MKLVITMVVFGILGVMALAGPAAAQSDSFDGQVIDLTKWDVVVGGASTVTQNNALFVTNDGTYPAIPNMPGLETFGPGTGVAARCKLSGDFDIQVDVLDLVATNLVSGSPQAFLNIYYVDEPHPMLHIKLIWEAVQVVPHGSMPGAYQIYYLQPGDEFLHQNFATLRIERTGSTLTASFDKGDGFGFHHAAIWGGMPTGDVFASLLLAGPLSPGEGTTSVKYDNYRVNSGTLICPVTKVAIDIKPGSYPNSINLGSAGVVPVAILSSPTFDATQVNPATVSLAGAKVKLIGKGDKYACSAQDVNGDGLLDLVCNAVTAQFLIEPGDSVAVLEADTFGGQHVRGEDSIRIVPD